MSEGSIARIDGNARSAFDPAHHVWVRWLARFGYAARGAIYLLIGALTLWTAIYAGEALGKKEAIRTVLDEPFGKPMLIALMVGLAGYVVWRLVQSVGDTDDHGRSAKGLGVRLGLLISGITYATLIWFVLSLVMPGLGEGDGQEGALARSREAFYVLLGNRWVLLAVGSAFAIVSGAHLWKAWEAKYEKHFVASDHEMRLIHPVARTGLAARGVVLAVIGGLFAWRGFGGGHDEGDGPAPGLDDALAFIADLPAGAWLLGGMGVGLLLFAGYSIIEAFYRRINVHDAELGEGGAES